MSAEEHYLSIGFLEGRNPSPNFSTLAYYKKYKDVLEKNVNPLLHYELYGKNENRQISAVDKPKPLADFTKDLSIFFSVILYVSDYCTPEEVRTALNSLYRQSYTNFEVLVIDNGITSFTYNVILEFIERNNNVKLISRKLVEAEKNKLLFGSSLKTAINLCTGDYVIFLNASDFIENNHINYLNTYIHKNLGIELILNNIEFIGNINKLFVLNESMQIFHSVVQNNQLKNLSNKIYIHFSCCCCKKLLLQKIDCSQALTMEQLFSSIRTQLSKEIHIGYLSNLQSFVRVNSNFSTLSNFFDTTSSKKENNDINNYCYKINYLIDQNFLKLNAALLETDAFINKTKKTISDLIALAEFFAQKKAYHYCIKVFYYIYNSLNFKKNDVLFRIFDCFLCEQELEAAEEILQSISPKNVDEENKFQHRKDSLNSAKAIRLDIRIEKIQLDNCVISDTNIMYCKASNLTKRELLLDNNLPHFSSFVIDQRNCNRLYIEPKLKQSKNRNYYILNLNLLRVNRIGIQLNDSSIRWLFSLRRIPTLGVLRGKNNWLFLANDSNKSESQFVGETLISNDEILSWKEYLNYIKNISNFMLLIPPSKEQVFPDNYPHKRAKICPINQLKQIIDAPSFKYIYPLKLLQNDENSYVKTETHWSYKAASSVFFYILNQFNIDIGNYKLPYTFSARRWVGDLGSKCNPQEFSDNFYVIDDLKISANIIFTNFASSNQQGKITKYHNDKAYLNKKIIIFGDSFSIFLLPFFTDFFADVINVWSNATVINEILISENPDYTIAEITERFIVKPPHVLSKIQDYKPSVRMDLAPKDLQHILEFENNKIHAVYQDYMKTYKSML